MTKFYQIINFQCQPLPKWYATQKDAVDYIDTLKKTYVDEKFYIIEIPIVYQSK